MEGDFSTPSVSPLVIEFFFLLENGGLKELTEKEIENLFSINLNTTREAIMWDAFKAHV